jgi:nucleoside-diphosphate-sugar epimerase
MTIEPTLPRVIWIAGCGFIGRPLAEALAAQGATVIGLTHSPASAEQLASETGLATRACDISSPAAVQELARTAPAPEAIVHCASSGRGGVDQYEQVYFQGCANFLETCPGAKLLFTSSTSVYPQVAGEAVDEDSPAEPDRDTGQVLRRTEDLVLAAKGVVARLAGLYGPGRSVLLQRFLDGTARIEEGESRYLNQVHRDDAVSALITLLSLREIAAGQIYNVADGEALTQRECYEQLAAHFGTAPPPEGPRDLNRKRGWTHKRLMIDKLKALGWQPRYQTFVDAVRTDPALVASVRP